MSSVRRRAFVTPAAAFVTLAAAPAAPAIARAEVRLPALVGSHMVLQREAPVRLWGWAASGEDVGERLARWALADTYGSHIEKSEPLGEGWIAADLFFKRNGRPAVHEDYVTFGLVDRMDRGPVVRARVAPRLRRHRSVALLRRRRDRLPHGPGQQ